MCLLCQEIQIILSVKLTLKTIFNNRRLKIISKVKKFITMSHYWICQILRQNKADIPLHLQLGEAQLGWIRVKHLNTQHGGKVISLSILEKQTSIQK